MSKKIVLQKVRYALAGKIWVIEIKQSFDKKCFFLEYYSRSAGSQIRHVIHRESSWDLNYMVEKLEKYVKNEQSLLGITIESTYKEIDEIPIQNPIEMKDRIYVSQL